SSAMQYSTTEGYRPLREYIAARYGKRFNMQVNPDEIMITNGSQQGLDLLGKVFLDAGDRVLLERPAYLGAIQAFGVFQPEFQTVLLQEDGADLEQLRERLGEAPIKLFYTVSNFQNPSGISYSPEKRRLVASILQNYDTVLVEDDPYSELCFRGATADPIRKYCEGNAVLLGSFSKIVAPGLRLGWIYAPAVIMEKLVIAKQGADLHSNYLAQQIVYQFLQDNDLDQHIATIKQAYQRQRDLMVELLERYCPAGVNFTRPEGGMFLWLTLPEGISSSELFEEAIKEDVAFVPGQAFYVDGSGANTLRLNFSNCDETQIEAGINRLAKTIERFLFKKELEWETWVGR
ncbi:MAG TPA: PLP-dependent aminotransferase family protein, partial [Bacillota bacterium]|nr:PLP-dependent aminotransferase family protein [Bacillota bacterium]